MVNYPISVHREKDHYWSTCPDLPEAHSAGDTLEELLANAVEGIQLALSICVDQGREIPAASEPSPGQYVVHQPIQIAAKAVLWNAMLRQGVRVADLGRLLGVSHPVAGRLVDFEHTSKIEQLEKALKYLACETYSPFESVVFYYVPLKDPGAYDKLRRWVNGQKMVSTEEASAIVLDALADKKTPPLLRAALESVIKSKFRYSSNSSWIYQDRQLGAGILFNFSAMPEGMTPKADWVHLPTSEVYKDQFTYRFLLGIPNSEDAA